MGQDTWRRDRSATHGRLCRDFHAWNDNLAAALNWAFRSPRGLTWRREAHRGPANANERHFSRGARAAQAGKTSRRYKYLHLQKPFWELLALYLASHGLRISLKFGVFPQPASIQIDLSTTSAAPDGLSDDLVV